MKSLLLILALALSFCSYSQNWIQKASLPSHVGVYAVISFSINNKLYVGSGYNGTTQVTTFYEYDPANDTWTQKANTPIAVDGAISFVLNGKGYMCCGTTGSLVNNVYAYDPATDSWQSKNNFPGSATQDGGGFSLNGKGYLCGGFTGWGTCSNEMWQYNDTTDTWTQMAPIPGPGRHGVFPLIVNGQVYVGQGSNASGTAWYSDLYRFNPDSNTYVPIDSFPTPLGGPVYYTIGQTGYMGLGYTGTSYPTAIYKYNPLANSWTIADTFNGGTRFVAFSQVVNGRPYIGCGIDSAGTYFFDCWTWDCTAPAITSDEDTLFASSASSYQWYLNDSAISGATLSYYIAAANGSYTVQTSDSTSCSSTSAPYVVTKTSVTHIAGSMPVKVYPNPAHDELTLQVNSQLFGAPYCLSDMTRRVILSGKISNEITRFSINDLSSGLYVLNIGTESFKVAKE